MVKKDPDLTLALAEEEWQQFLTEVRSGASVDLRKFCESRPALSASLFGEGGPPASFLDQLLDQLGEAGNTSASRSAKFVEELTPQGTRYEIISELARGGMGAILRAFDPQLRRQLAMKVILDEGDGSRAKRLLPRFLQEAQVTGQLEHPGIVPVHELGIDENNRVYFTMQLVEGLDLEEVIAQLHSKKADWSLPRVLESLSRASEAIAFAHSRGIIHRDLKPANIMVGAFGECYVMDWGLAKVTGEVETTEEDAPDLEPMHTQMGTVVGTPAYMSPEQASGQTEEIDARTDVYAMGAILYHVLTGKAPYADRPSSAQELISRVLSEDPQEIERVDPTCSVELASIARKAMSRNPEERYPSMVEMAADLRAYLENRVVRAHRTGAVAELRAWVRRNRGTAAAITLSSLILIAGLVLWRTDSELKYREILRLTDARVLETAIEAEKELGVPRPSAASKYASWLLDPIAGLRERLPQHRRELLEQRANALTYSDADAERDRSTHPLQDELKTKIVEKALRTKQIKDVREAIPEGSKWESALLDRSQTLDLEIAELHQTMEERRTWRFSEVKDRWRHDRLTELVEGLEQIFGQDGLVSEVEARLEFARTVDATTLTDSEPARLWAEAIEAIAQSEHYGGFRLPRQTGLIPLGENPQGLWEFWDVFTGEKPKPAETDSPNRWIITPETGVVFILVPGGVSTIGATGIRIGIDKLKENQQGGLLVNEVVDSSLAQRAGMRVGDILLSLNGRSIRFDSQLQAAKPSIKLGEQTEFVVLRGGNKITLTAEVGRGVGSPSVDPWAAGDEDPPTEVPLSPFFLSKYEFTIAQWRRLSKQTPNGYHVGYPVPYQPAVSAIHPVERISWLDCDEWLPRIGFVLPTEAQWEYAARAGTLSIWPTGNTAASLSDYANLYDRTARAAVVLKQPLPPAPFDDGYAAHAPVGTYLPNGWGFHDMAGNVQERCQDWKDDYKDVTFRAGDGLRSANLERYRVLRGGSWRTQVQGARAANRGSELPDEVDATVGVRPARRIEGIE